MRRRLCVLLAVVAFAAGCGKKGGAGSAAAAATEGAKGLPPGAAVYVQVDMKAVLASPLAATFKDMLLAKLPEPCRGSLDAVRNIVLATYGDPDKAFFLMPRKKEEPKPAPGDVERVRPSTDPEQGPPMPDFVMTVTGPTRDQLRTCLAAASAGEGAALRTENRNGREVLLSPAGDKAAFSADDTTHVVASTTMLDAALAAASGGPSLAGGDILAALSGVPDGEIALSALFPPALAADMAEGLAFFAGGKPITPPRSMAVSVSLASGIAITAALNMPDEASATALEQIVGGAISLAKLAVGAAAHAGGGGRGEGDDLAALKPVLDSLSVSRSGAALVVRVSVTPEAIGYLLTKSESQGRRGP
jgi:hypothetical protein